MVSYVKDDLQFILDQIKLSEQHATKEDATGAPVLGTPLDQLIPNPLLPWGVRTVDGSYNNIIPGREDFGAADEIFPRLLDPVFRDAEASPPGMPPMGGPTSYSQTSGLVFDSQPRIISNLVVDQTLNNPAAILAALKYNEITGSEAHAIQQEISGLYAALAPLRDAAQSSQNALDQAQSNLTLAQQNLANAQAANAAAVATLAAYDAALVAQANALTALQELAVSAAALVAALADGSALAGGSVAVDGADTAALAEVLTDLGEVVAAAQDIVAALSSDPNVVPADLADAQAFLSDAQAALDLADNINLLDGDATPTEQLIADFIDAISTTQVTDLSSLQSQLTASQNGILGSAPDLAQAIQDVQDAQAAYDSALAADNAADAALAAASTELNDTLAEHGLETTQNGSLVIPNVAPDEGISAPFNSWMTLFGQFFDHGLDLVTKGGSGTVFVPLQPDDPLYVPGGHTNFMVLTRATNQPGPDGILGTADDIHEHTNTTTPFVDQNQTYTSHASHQVFLREYKLDGNGRPVATGHLLEGDNGGLATWADIKEQAHTLLGITLTDADVTNVPLLATDEYGRFLRGPNGFAQVVVRAGDGSTMLVEGTAAGLDLTDTLALGGTVVRTGHAFLDDIAHAANPYGDHDGNPSTPNQLLTPDANPDTGGSLDIPALGTYDNELLDRHFITGDGRGNENIGLTTVHHVFHSEHNRLVEHTKDVVIATGDLAFINDWLINPIGSLADIPADIDTLDWNGERLFQAARFGTEMQYQHLVFEEFARKVNPAVDLFVFNPTMDIDPAIFAEFAHVVYRFGHSMLTETIDRLGADGQTSDDIGLIEAFLNPVEFDKDGTLTADQAAGAIVRGMTRQTGNEIDEFVTDALRNNLLGLPLDLATINMTRARDTGVPSLNIAREQFYEMTKSEWLKPYASWVDFAQHIKNPASVINFIAAYGTHPLIQAATTAEAKRAVATAIVLGGNDAPADRLDFLNARNAYAGGSLGGLNDVDLWIGGLAEAILPFGGMLGSTFTFVFEMQLENLQNGDRFYYLSRTQGLHFITELENNAFSKLIKLNTDLGNPGSTHLPGEIFARVDHILEINKTIQLEDDPVHDDPILGALEPKVARDLHLTFDGNTYQHSLKFVGGEHVVLGGTDDDDVLIADLGDDTIWGDGGNDLIIGGHGINRLHGGTGNDIIYGGGDAEFIHGDEGNDVIHGGNGLGDLIFGGDGDDFIIGGIDGKEVFAGLGNDFILGSPDVDFLLGGEGDDWIEGGEGFDTIAGENSQLFFNSSIVGHDVMFAGTNEMDFDAESGDDIMVQGESVMRNEGMFGFDWVIFKDMPLPANADMRIKIFTSVEADILRNRFDRVEAMSGWDLSDILIGDDRVAPEIGDGEEELLPENTFADDQLTREGVERIAGLREVLGLTQAQLDAFAPDATVYNSGNIILGGDSSDIIQGGGGDDIIDGDAWLNVRIGITNAQGVEIGTAERMQGEVTIYSEFMSEFGAWNGKQLDTLMFSRQLDAGRLKIVREILNDTQDNDAASPTYDGDYDSAVFRGNLNEYVVRDANGNIIDLTAPNLMVRGRITVQHTLGDPGDINFDGTDTLINVERLVFADQSVDLVPGLNAAPVGAPTIVAVDGIFQAGRPLTIQLNPDGSLAGVTDANNPGGVVTGPFTVRWQIEDAPDSGVFVDALAVGLVFTPSGDPAIGLNGERVRAIVSYLDGHNVREFVASTPSDPLIPGTNLLATEGDDLLVGTAGADVIDGLGGDDEIQGLAGNDTLIGGPGDDTLLGGQGRDTLIGGPGSDILDGGAGNNDTAVFDGALADFTIEFTPDGTLEVVRTAGGEEDEIINIEILEFDDQIITIQQAEALAGVIRLAAGQTTFNGTAAPEFIIGTGAAETISGAGGDDLIHGNGGADTLNGNAGRDTIFGGNGADTINGGADDDTLFGENGADDISGGAGNDTITGGAGNDTINGNGGTDVAIFSGNLADYTFANGAGGSIVVTDTVSNRDGQDTLTNIELLTFADQDVTIAAVQTIIAGGGQPPAGIVHIVDSTPEDGIVTAAVGQLLTANVTVQYDYDEIASIGYQWQSSVDGQTWTPIAGANGTQFTPRASEAGQLLRMALTYVFVNAAIPPQIVYSDPTPAVVDLSTGTGNNQPPPPAQTQTGSNLIGSTGEDTLVGTSAGDVLAGLAGADTILAGDGNNSISGDAGNDYIVSGSGNDVILAGADNDTVISGAGDDMIFGGSGDDTILAGDGNDLIDGGSGRDVVDAGAGNDVVLAAIGDGDDVYDGGAGIDTIDFSAISADVTINLGASGFGTATGTQTGNDVIRNFENAVGGSGNDTIVANNLVNVLTGGFGADTFVFGSVSAANQDQITDFQVGDRIDLSGIDANLGLDGNQAFQLILGQPTFTAAGQVIFRYEQREDGEHTIVEGNVDQDLNSDFRIDLVGRHNLTVSDFNL